MGRLVFRCEGLGQIIYYWFKDMWWPGIRGMASVTGLLPRSGIAST